MDVHIQNAHGKASAGECCCGIDSDRTFADPAFAAHDEQLVLNLVQRGGNKRILKQNGGVRPAMATSPGT
jgi:hypothetical protein